MHMFADPSSDPRSRLELVECRCVSDPHEADFLKRYNGLGTVQRHGLFISATEVICELSCWVVSLLLFR